MPPYSVLPEEVNDNQIKALVNYIQSQKLTDRVPSPTNLGVVEAIKNQQVIAPTANDFRRYAADVALNSQLGGEWWNPKTNPEGYRPLARKKVIGQSIDPDAEINPLYVRGPVEQPVNQPTYYTPGFENYVDPWIAWEDAWGETYTPQ